MHPIIHDVAVSVDGYISGPGGDISAFAQEGPVVDDYLARLAAYDTAIMGRATYEFGYAFGLEPGANPYPHMKTHVFSRTLALPADSHVTLVRGLDRQSLAAIRDASNGAVYLCGGGAFAGAVLALGLLDRLRLKRAPAILGGGVPLFGSAGAKPLLRARETRSYDGGYLYQEYDVLR